MDILKTYKKEKTSPSVKKVKFNNVKVQTTKKSNDENPLKQKRFSFRMKKEKENSVKKGLLEKIKLSKNNNLDNASEKYFMKRILQIKKEINKNEFAHHSENGEINNNLNDSMMKKIGSDLKQSLNMLKYESGFDIATIKTIKSKKTAKTKRENTLMKCSTKSPKSRKNSNIKSLDNNLLKTTENNLDKSNALIEDISYGNLLMDNKNNSKLELLNNEEKKNNITAVQNNANKKKNEKIRMDVGNKSNKSNIRKSNEKFRILLNKGLVYDSFDDEEEFEDQINKEFFIMPNSIFIIILDILIVFDIFYYLTYNPYYIASSTKFIYSNISFYDVYHFFMEIVYLIDFLVQFVRAYYDFYENLVTIKKKIIKHYLSSWFLIDLITIIPTFSLIKIYYEKEKYNRGYDYVCNFGCQLDNIMNLLCFIKLIKIIKILARNQNQVISFIWSHLSNTSFIDNWGTIIFQVSLALFCLHITACFHIIIGRNSYPNWITEHNLSSSDFGTIYTVSIYFLIATMTSVGYGDITGNSFKEHVFQIFLLIIGIMAYSWLVSSVSNYVIENNKDNIFFESKVNILDEIKIAHPEMDNELYNKIYSHLKQLKIIHKKKDKNILLDSLPYNIRNSLLYEINRPLIEGLNFFKNFHNSVFILSAVTKLIPIVTNKGDIIIEQNEIINSMVFVKQGRLAVEIAVDMNNIYSEVDKYINGTFILGEEKNDKKKKDKEFELKRSNTMSLMTTLNYTMDDSFIAGKKGRRLGLNYKKPVSFRKRLLKFMQNKFGRKIEPIFKREKKIKYVKLYYIRKGEQFGEIFMFLNKPSSFTLRVRSPKAELLLLKKIDAIEISSNYPNIWKRANQKSFNNLIHIKELVSHEMIKFCGKHGIKYNYSYKFGDVRRSNSSPAIEKIEKIKDQKSNLSRKFRNFQKNSQNSLIPHKTTRKKIVKINDNNSYNSKSNLKYQSTKFISNKSNKNYSLLKLSDSEDKEEDNNNNVDKNNNNVNNVDSNLTPYREDEVNDELYIGEELFKNINKDINCSNQSNSVNEKINFKLLKNYDINHDNFDDNRNNKSLNKLIDSSRRKKNSKIYYHKSRKSILKNKSNYNFHYNINNSFNINQIQRNSKFCPNQLTIANTISFNIKKTYDNLNAISKGNYKKDINFQKTIKSLIQNKYNISNTNNSKINSSHSNLIHKFTRKETRVNSLVAPKQTFYKKGSQIFSLIKESGIKNDQIKNKRRKSLENIKELKPNKDEKEKKEGQNESNAMLNIITQNIIDGDKNLNNPEIFYNELFANIIQNKKTDLSSSIIMKNNLRSSLRNKGNEEKKISKKQSMLYFMPKNIFK